MVRISRQRLVASRPGANRLRGGQAPPPEAMYGAAGLIGMVLFFGLYFTWMSSREGINGGIAGGPSSLLSKNGNVRSGGPLHPQLHVPDKNSDQYDALAMDILQTLNCAQVLNKTIPQGGGGDNEFMMGQDDPVGGGGGIDNVAMRRRRRRRRRLDDIVAQPDSPDQNNNNNNAAGFGGGGGGFDDFNDAMADDLGDINFLIANARHLFCLVAAEDVTTEAFKMWQEKIQCDANRHRKSLLDLWNAARSRFSNDINLLKSVLDMSQEGTYVIADEELALWDPISDMGLDYMVKHVNNKTKTVDDGGLYGLEHNLGPGRIFVDVGSGLGTTSIAMSILYPGTRIVSIEVASPNWLLQEMNWRCNADTLTNPPTAILSAGVGPATTQTSFATYLWKPDLTTATRSWTPASERKYNDVEIFVELQSWHTLRATAEFQHVDVLNVDCGACEYNFIPALTDEEFDSIHTVMGGLHWGYIPESRLPSSKRARETHQRLCQHENFAKTAKECCDVPDLSVKSSYPGQILVHDNGGHLPKAGTVGDVAGDFCDDFAQWAKEKHLHDIPNDYGWFQIASVADGY